MAAGMGAQLFLYAEKMTQTIASRGKQSMLEKIFELQKLVGFNHLALAILHIGRIIEECFGHGKCLGVQIIYTR